MVASQHNLRLLRPVADPIAWYIRVGFNDHKTLENRLSAGDTRINRAVIDATCIERHSSLITALQTWQAELVLDPRSAELPMQIEPKKNLQDLDWYEKASEADPEQYDQHRVDSIAAEIAATVVAHGFSSVLAPAHYLDERNKAWIDVDVSLTRALRDKLDRGGAKDVKIYYPLLVPYSWFSSLSEMRPIAGVLSMLPLDAVWLRVSNFQNDKSAAAVRNYIESARTLLTSDRPVIADHVGGLSALAILAFGAAGGITHGIGVREGFKVRTWRKAPGRSFGVTARTYVPDADMYLDRRTLGPLLDDPVIRNGFGCKNKDCCPRGVEDMFSNTKVHHMNSRFDQLAIVGDSTDSQRSANFVRRVLVPTGARLIKLDHSLTKFPELQGRVQRKRRFVDELKATLESLAAETRIDTRTSRIPRRVPYKPLAVANNNDSRPSL